MSTESRHKPIRVLQVFGTLDRGGADTSIMTFYHNIDRSVVQFDFVVHGPRVGAFEEEIKALGGRIYRVPRLGLLTVFRYLREWSRLLADHPEFRIVHGHYFTISGIYLAVAKLHRRKIIVHVHNTIPGALGRLAVVINWWLRYGADLRLACSNDAARFLFGSSAVQHRKTSVLKNPIEVTSFAFDPNERSSTRERLGVGDRLVVGHVGRFDRQKNHVFLIDIFQEVLKKEPESVLLLVGDGPLRGDIEHRIREKGLTKSVIFTGVTSEVASLLQAMDVFVLPSLYEGFGVVAIEAQTAGLPTTVSDVIPTEVMVTDLVEVVSLSSPSSEWASTILRRISRESRVSNAEVIIKAGFDGQTSAYHLEEFYSKLATD